MGFKVRKEPDLELQEETLRNRSGPEVEGKDEGECQCRDGDGHHRRKEDRGEEGLEVLGIGAKKKEGEGQEEVQRRIRDSGMGK